LWYDGFGIDDAGFDGADSGEKTSGILAAVIELDLADHGGAQAGRFGRIDKGGGMAGQVHDGYGQGELFVWEFA
jgi:hypothetical protein